MKPRFVLPIAAGVLSATTMALADGQPPFVLPTTPSVVRYHLHEDENGPDGTSRRDQAVSLTRRGDGYDAVVSSSGRPDETLSLSLADGALAASDPPDDDRSTVEALGFLVALVHHDGSIAAGQTWNVTTTVDLPGGDTSRVPLAVTATAVRGDDVTLAATGNGTGTIHGKGHAANANVDIVLQASFHDGQVVSATTTRKVSAHVPFHTITFTDAWSITS